jgi:signal transduction histidine kinase
MKKRIVIILCVIINILISYPSISFSETYRVAGDKQFPPYEYVDSDGVFKGFNVDIIKAISLVTGINFEFIPMKWEDAYYAIDRGQADIIQGMKESDERKYKFLFTDSLLVNSQSIFVLDDNRTIYSNKDLEGKTIALNKEDIIYKDISKLKDVTIFQYDSLEEALNALLVGDVDALIGNTTTVNYLCKEKNCIDLVKIVGDTLNEQKYAMAVALDNEELLEKLNRGIAEIQENGMYDSLYRKWFGTPIKNMKTRYEILLKVSLGICGALVFVVLVVQSFNKQLKETIEVKTEEQKALINELRHYDKMQFMDKIISSVAHEIRNPLTSIKLYSSQMKSKIDDKEFLMAASEDIPEEIDRIDALIKEFMEYTSPRKPVIEDFNLYEELINSIKLFKLQIKNIELKIDVDKSYYIKFDISQFKQMVLNILLNSMDAVKDVESPIIEISAVESDEEIILYFKDNGYGMNEDNIQYIFEPFYTTKVSGNGVGMFIVKQIVDENGGSISAKSDGEHKGMCIIVKTKKGELNEE